MIDKADTAGARHGTTTMNKGSDVPFSDLFRSPADFASIQLTDAGKAVRIRHIINPVKKPPMSDLAIAQGVSFDAMRNAREFAAIVDPSLEVSFAAVALKEEASAIPEDFEQGPSLDRSIADLGIGAEDRRLPLLFDILKAGATAESDLEEWLLFTNVDIAPLPHFYCALAALVRRDVDVAIVNRRTLPASHAVNPDQALLASDFGTSHPGFDCFLFPRAMLERFVPSESCVGAGFVMRPLLYNLAALAQRMVILREAHLTFHIGDERPWLDQSARAYLEFNQQEALRVLTALCQDPGRQRRLHAFAEALDEGWLPDGFFGDDDWRIKKRKPKGLARLFSKLPKRS